MLSFAIQPAKLPALAGELPPDHARISIPYGNRGTAETILVMQQLVGLGKRDFALRELLGKILRDAAPPEKDYRAQAEAIFQYCQKKIRYVHDPVGIEYVEHPLAIVRSGIADCDSVCVLLAALLECAGFPAWFVTIKADANFPDDFSHVYVRVKVPRSGVFGADATVKDKPFGWNPPRTFPEKQWPSSAETADMENALANYMGTVLLSGAAPDANIDRAKVTITAIVDGSYARQLAEARTDYQNRIGNAYTLSNAVDKIADPQKRAAAAAAAKRAIDATLAEGRTLNDAIMAYDKLANDIATYSLGVLAPPPLGLAPAAVAAVAVVAVSLAVAANSFSTLVGTLNGNQNASKGYIAQAADLVRESGVAVEKTSNFALVAAGIGAAGLAVYLAYRKWGKKTGKGAARAS